MTNYYAQEVCTPSRAALLTGRYPLTTGMQYGVIDTRVPWGLDLTEQTLAEVLRDAGYKTHALGKVLMRPTLAEALNRPRCSPLTPAASFLISQFLALSFSFSSQWHLGHHTPKYLPTARGFQSFVGFLNGD